MVGGSRRSALNLQRARRPQLLHDRWVRQRNPAPCAALQDDPDTPQRCPVSLRAPIVLAGAEVLGRSESLSCSCSPSSVKNMSVYRCCRSNLWALGRLSKAATYNPLIIQLASCHEDHSTNGCQRKGSRPCTEVGQTLPAGNHTQRLRATCGLW